MRAFFVLACVALTSMGCGGETGSGRHCGDGVLDEGEACDGVELGGETCESLGYYGGELSCADDCQLDLTSCEAAGYCGDGAVDTDQGEVCDTAALGGETCETLGYPGGVLACGDDCQLDWTGCDGAGLCGDGSVDVGEECDTAELDGETCETLGYYGGALACGDDCRFDLTSCEAAGRCGDGAIDAGAGEACDTAELGGETCEHLGYHGGVLACGDDCQLDLTSCEAAGYCGDGQVNGPEQCDASDLGGETCVGLGYHDATLSCDGSCALDTSGCEAAGYCGDGVINGPEQCDTAALGGATCESLGHEGGPLACGSGCVLDESGCLDDPCLAAEWRETNEGCLFYAVDSDTLLDSLQFAVVAGNPHDTDTAMVEVQTRNGGVWQMLQQASVAPQAIHQFNLPDRQILDTGLNAAGAYRIVSDRPVALYQFQPVDGVSSNASDSSLLLPVSTLDSTYMVVGWGPSVSAGLNPLVQIVAAYDNTTVTIVPSVSTLAGGGVAALTAGVPHTFAPMNAGDYLQLANGANESFNGTVITADQPIAVFSAHECANIPLGYVYCDHLEEQLPAVSRWGRTTVAARFPPRDTANPEASIWQIVAAEDDTVLNFVAHADVTGLPAAAATLQAGEVLELTVSGSVAQPGDFFIYTDRPIMVAQYLSSESYVPNVPQALAGDPAMVLLPAPSQFLDAYSLLVPLNWVYDFLVLTKAVGETVYIDGVAVPQAEFVTVGPSAGTPAWEVARVAITDGAHNLTGTAPFGVLQLGYDSYDSYAHPGGMAQYTVN